MVEQKTRGRYSAARGGAVSGGVETEGRITGKGARRHLPWWKPSSAGGGGGHSGCLWRGGRWESQVHFNRQLIAVRVLYVHQRQLSNESAFSRISKMLQASLFSVFSAVTSCVVFMADLSQTQLGIEVCEIFFLFLFFKYFNILRVESRRCINYILHVPHTLIWERNVRK